MKKTNYIFSVVMLVIGLSILFLSIQLPKNSVAWPKFFAIILILLSLGLIIETILKGKKTKMEDKKDSPKIGLTDKILVFTVLASVVYLVIMEHIGFLLLTPFFIVFLLWLLEYRSKKKVLILSVGITVVLVIVFQYLLDVPIPQGILENFL